MRLGTERVRSLQNVHPELEGSSLTHDPHVFDSIELLNRKMEVAAAEEDYSLAADLKAQRDALRAPLSPQDEMVMELLTNLRKGRCVPSLYLTPEYPSSFSRANSALAASIPCPALIVQRSCAKR